MYCPNCGQQIADSLRFCPNCGAPQQPAAPQAPAYAPQAPAYPPQTPASVPGKPARKKPVWLFLLLGVVVLALLVTAGILLFGGKTIYLQTEIVTETAGSSTTTIRREYDDQGRLVEMEQETEVASGFSLRAIRYEYNEEGLLESAELEIGSSYQSDTAEVEYIYRNGVLTDIEVDREGMSEYEISFTKKGQIKCVRLLSNGEEQAVYNYRYHDNGMLKEANFELSSGRNGFTNSYDELGRLISTETTFYGEAQSSIEYEYVGDTSIQSKMVNVTYQGGVPVNTMTMITDMVKKGNKLVELTLTVQVETEDEEYEIRFSGEVEWDGLEGTWSPKAKGDLDELEGDVDPDSMELVLEMDDHGNLIAYSIGLEDVEAIVMEAEYTPIRVRRNYTTPVTSDPIFSLAWLG